MKLAYRKRGHGPTVVFIHGFCESKELWQTFENHFAAFCQTLVVDLPGFGESTANSHYESIEAMAEEVYGVLEAEKINSYLVVGHSMGGYVALALAERAPERLSGLCLFHSTAYADSDEKKHTRDKTAEFIRKRGIKPFLDTFVPSIFFDKRKEELADRIRTYDQLARQTPTESAAAATLAMRDRPDRTHVLTQATYPVLFMAGKADTAVPLESSKEQFFLPPNSTIQLLADTGHMGMYEREAETLAMLENFVKRVLFPLEQPVPNREA